MVCAQIIFWPNYVLNFCFLYCYSGVDKKLTRFCKEFADLEGIRVDQEKIDGLYRSLAARVSVMGVLMLATSILFTRAHAYFLFDVFGYSAGSYFAFVFSLSVIVVTFFPPFVTFTHLLANQCLGGLKLALDSYEGLLEGALSADETSNIGILLRTGFRLEDLVNQANAMFGGIIWVELALCLVIEVGSIYFSMTLAFVLDDDSEGFKPVVLCFGISGLTMATFSCIRRFSYLVTGHRLRRGFSSCKRLLQDIQSKYSKDVLCKASRTDLKILIDRYSPQCPVRPMDSFNLDLSAALAMDGAIITYTIVLMQFKLNA